MRKSNFLQKAFELASDRRWQEAFDKSGDDLDRLAEEALGERRAGKTRALEVDGTQRRRVTMMSPLDRL